MRFDARPMAMMRWAMNALRQKWRSFEAARSTLEIRATTPDSGTGNRELFNE